MSSKDLIIKGARQNNLKGIDLCLPHDTVIAITGVSGSGKSSLAFDTIFAEGQWRFIESLSTYARLFLEKLDRPEVDAIYNIRPAIALEQKNPIRGSRSTVGTLTEIYDLFRLLYAKIATPYCPKCGREIRMWDPSQVASELIEKFSGEKAIVIFETESPLDELNKRGFHRIWLGEEVINLPEKPGPGLESDRSAKTKQTSESYEVVLDRLVVRNDPRLSDSIEMAWKEGNGRIKIVLVTGESLKTLNFSSENACEECNIQVPKPYPLLFSFNHPVGACPECKGFGNILRYDEDLIVPDRSLSLSKGAVDPWNKPAYRWWRQQLLKNASKEHLNTNKPYSQLSEKEKEILYKGASTLHGIDAFFAEMEERRYKLHIRVFLSRYRRPVTCSVCQGKRLNENALAYRIDNLDIAGLCALPISETSRFFRNLDISPYQRDTAKEILRQIVTKLEFLKRVGLDYLGLDRDGRTLSGGEYQRVNLANQIASLLTGTLYVLDEPTVGLHARDTEIVAGIMTDLSKLGNTVIVVEHDKKIIESSDWIVELGPGGGHKGGEVVFSGRLNEFLKTDTPTARYIKGMDIVEPPMKGRRTLSTDGIAKRIVLSGASGNNLKSVDLEIPLHTLTTVSGVSGSGKSSLIIETLYRALAREMKQEFALSLPYSKVEGLNFLKGVKLISQAPIGRSPRSNPVTYLKVFDLVRKLFSDQPEARAYRYEPGFFSFNVPGGRCETCKGAGYQKMEMYFFEDLYIKCEDCNGKRYKPEALRVYYRGKNIDDILNLTVEEALIFFHSEPKILSRLSLMQEIGLGYLKLGQPATTLSGGEAQRLKICAEFAMGDKDREDILYILDEPTIGLHFRDVESLLKVLQRLVDSGNTVLVIEHNLDVIRASDWIIDLGPEGGDKGGRIIFTGTPDEIVKAKKSYTGKYLREHIQSA
jgi:excinuclease ABC subunit A